MQDEAFTGFEEMVDGIMDIAEKILMRVLSLLALKQLKKWVGNCSK